MAGKRGRQPASRLQTCPECGKLMVYHKNSSKFECVNASCPLIEVRLNRHKRKVLYAANFKKVKSRDFC